jgi:putative hemolysin
MLRVAERRSVRCAHPGRVTTMRRLLIVGWCLVLLAGCGGTEPAEVDPGLANPASTFCEEQGGTVEIRTDAEGAAYGVCVFDDGAECEEWAFYRGECTPAVVETQEAVQATVDVDVFFSNEALGDPCGQVFPVSRSVPADDPVRAALEALVAGPTEEEVAEGYGGWFSAETQDVLRSLTVADGTAHADFTDLRRVIPNASTSCGSAALLAELDTTLLQFPDVHATRYSINGSAEDFYEWLQLEAPPEH